MTKPKIILAFIGVLLAIAIPGELIPTKKVGLVAVIIYLILGTIGAIVYLKKTTNTKKLGLISLIIGYTLEFAIMRPDWVRALWGEVPFDPGRAFAVVSNIAYWFAIWAVPSYVLNRLKFKDIGG
jgi:hypothetical protein